MKLNRHLLLFCGSLALEIACAADPGQAAKHTPAPAAAPAEVVGPSTAVRSVVAYNASEVVPVKTKLRYTTLIILPKTEKILDYTCGDREFWVVNGSQNFAYIKPAKAGAQTNLNLCDGQWQHLFISFVLAEVSDGPKAEPDFKIFIELKDEGMASAATAAPRFVSAQELEDAKRQAAAAKDEARQVKKSEQANIDKGIHQFVSNVRFAYQFAAGQKPLNVRSMYHDDRFTYIQARPEETPTLYEVKDGKPNLVNFQYRDGVYIASKILDQGYLAIGKQKLAFKREE